jgi:hypothetical protein
MASTSTHLRVLAIALLALTWAALVLGESKQGPEVFKCPAGCAGVRIGDVTRRSSEPTCPPGTKCETKGVILGLMHCYCKPETGFFTGTSKGR